MSVQRCPCESELRNRNKTMLRLLAVRERTLEEKSLLYSYFIISIIIIASLQYSELLGTSTVIWKKEKQCQRLPFHSWLHDKSFCIVQTCYWQNKMIRPGNPSSLSLKSKDKLPCGIQNFAGLILLIKEPSWLYERRHPVASMKLMILLQKEVFKLEVLSWCKASSRRNSDGPFWRLRKSYWLIAIIVNSCMEVKWSEAYGMEVNGLLLGVEIVSEGVIQKGCLQAVRQRPRGDTFPMTTDERASIGAWVIHIHTSILCCEPIAWKENRNTRFDVQLPNRFELQQSYMDNDERLHSNDETINLQWRISRWISLASIVLTSGYGYLYGRNWEEMMRDVVKTVPTNDSRRWMPLVAEEWGGILMMVEDILVLYYIYYHRHEPERNCQNLVARSSHILIQESL